MSIKRKGKKFNDNHKKAISEALKKLFENPVNCPNWRGGLSFEPYSVDWNETLKRSIKERDHYICQLCYKADDLVVHHIDYNKKNCSPDNLITLCNSCNVKVNFSREKWTNYFQK